jgi:peptidoglycan/xylan/chitin deacetylase (PgdA/CDA1 family)
VEAAFFCIGHRVTAHPELAARIVSCGHLLENHTYAHSKTTNLFSVDRLRTDLARAQTVIQQTTGTAPLLFRPPMGLSNPNVFCAARSLGLTVVGWSARSLDTRITEPERIVARIERRLKPGAIILLHDGNIPAGRLVATVKLLLDRLHVLGYDVVRLDRMLT